jgi:hypothetical protein
MSDIIKDAVRAGCAFSQFGGCQYPDRCGCHNRAWAERAARYAAEAMREKAAQKADECAEHWATAAGDDNVDFTPGERRIARGAALTDNAVAAQIRAIPIEGETT